VEFEIKIKNTVQNKVKRDGEGFKAELVMLRKIIMNPKLVNKYKERVERIGHTQDSNMQDNIEEEDYSSMQDQSEITTIVNQNNDTLIGYDDDQFRN